MRFGIPREKNRSQGFDEAMSLPERPNGVNGANGAGGTNGYSHDVEDKAADAPDYDYTLRHEKGNARRRSSMFRGKPVGYEEEDPFGDESDAEVKYRTMTWWQAALIMIAETISLGILSLPSVLGTVGMVPGIILIAGLGIVATYTAYVIGQFKMAYPYVHSMGDAGEVLFTPYGPLAAKIARELFGGAQVIFLIFSMGSHVLIWTIMLNVVTEHATCTIVWSVIGVIVFWICDQPRTLKATSWLAIGSFISIFSAVLITEIDIGITKPYQGPIEATTVVPFATAFISIGNIVFAYAGHVAFFGFISEMKNPKDWPKTVYLLQAADVSMYLVAAIVIYYYGGPDVASPAFGSIPTLPSKIAWGIAIPTIIVAGVIYGHVVTKYVYVRIFRGTKHMSQKTVLSIGSWAAISGVAWILAWIVAESIPVFNDLLSLISALFAAWFTYGISGIMWIFLNWGQLFSSPKKTALTLINFGIFLIGGAVCGIGLYASGKAIKEENTSNSWTCADNSST